jgi:hypothetical protein
VRSVSRIEEEAWELSMEAEFTHPLPTI